MAKVSKTAEGPRIDLLGRVAFAVYIVIGGVFVFGFGRSLTSAIQTQNDTPCRAMGPRHARIEGRVVDDGGKPVPGAEVVPIEGGRAGLPIATDDEGAFTVFLPKRSQGLLARAPGRAPVQTQLSLASADLLEVEIVLAAEGGTSTFTEQSRQTFEAPDFVAQDLQGNEVRLSDFRGKLVVLNFWATWCEPCITEWPQLARLGERLVDRDDVVILAVSVEEDQAEIVPFLERMALTDSRVTVLWDPSASVNQQFGSNKLPDTFFVDEQGRVTDVFVNVREWGSPDAYHCVEASVGR
ncbi:MAG: redoxin domain-containing protein [Nannocystaceae bacterium]